MDNFESSDFGKKKDLDVPIPFDDDDTSNSNIPRSPLSLGGGKAEAPKIGVAKPFEKKLAKKIVSCDDRITGAKTFFTKLHVGSIEFLDEQITNWLKDNPGVKIKRTNTVAGMVIGKKTEPNIIITVWY